MSVFNIYPNADAALINLLKQLKFGISPQDVMDELEKHPDYPSLLAISDVLNWFKINNAAYRIKPDDLMEVPTPFIAHTNRDDDFVLVKRIRNNKVTLSDGIHKNETLSIDEFKKCFKGIVLTAEAPSNNTDIKSQSWPDRIAPYKVPTAITILVVSFILIVVYLSPLWINFNWRLALIALFKTAGLTTSVLLLMQSIDKNNPLVQTLCGGSGKNNCNAILTSKAALVFKGLSWSEVGFFYFAGTWLALLFGTKSATVLNVLAWGNIISLPYTLYSFNYQVRIAKQWCLLCTTIQVLLWLEFIPLVTYVKIPAGFSDKDLLGMLICFAFPMALWLLLKPLLLKGQQLNTLKQQTRQFKYNRKWFETALKVQPQYTLPDKDWSIVLGTAEANTIITMVSNPYCPPCSKAHIELDEWLARLDDIQLRIVFTADNNEDDKKTPITRHLMALNEQSDRQVVKQALIDWYEQKQKNYEEWAKVYQVKLDESKFIVLEKQKLWCHMAEITATPTILVNGSCLPEFYSLYDIKYMLG